MKILTLKNIKNKDILLSADELYRSYQADLIFPMTHLRKKFLRNKKFARFYNGLRIEKDKHNDFLIMADLSTVYGIAFVEFSPFETNIFAKKMGMLHIKLSDHPSPPLLKGRRGDYGNSHNIKMFINAINTLAENGKYEHISIRIPVNNTSLIIFLQECGYIHISGLVTLVYNKDKTSTRRLKKIYKVRLASQGDQKRILKISENAFSGTRFVSDPSLDKSKCSELYRKWIKNCFDSGWASNVFVAVNSRDEVVGFLTYLIDFELKKKANITKLGRGLAACLPNSKGALISLLQNSLDLDLEKTGADFIEYTTPLENLEMISVCNRFGLDLCKIEHIFRKEFKR